MVQPTRRSPPPRISTGIAGLDEILGADRFAERVCLVERTPGTGNTTFGLQFLLKGTAQGERSRYITLAETHVSDE